MPSGSKYIINSVRTGQFHECRTVQAAACQVVDDESKGRDRRILTAVQPPKESDILTDYLTRNESQNKSYVSRNGKEARLKYTLIQKTERYFLLEVELFTGRHHQIRCQLAHMGCPIKGDLKYGAKRSNPDGGISLLARHIQFIHPVKKTEVDVTAPVPDSWKGIQG